MEFLRLEAAKKQSQNKANFKAQTTLKRVEQNSEVR